MTKGCDGQVRAGCWKLRTSRWPLWAPLGRPWIVFSLLFPLFELLGSTWIFMSVLHKLYENHSFHWYSNAKWTSEFNDFLIFPSNSQLSKNKENMNCLFFISIPAVLSSGAPPIHMFFPLKCSKKSIENAPVKTYEIQKTYLKPMKYQHLHLLKSK